MVDVATVPGWPAVGSLAAGVGTLALARAVVRYRNRPGATPFLGVLASQALWCFAYGVGLFVFDPALRVAFEIAVWIGIVWVGVTFLAFALEYTGRGDVIAGPAFHGFVALGVLATLAIVTNPLHGVLWTDVRLTPVFGVAAVTYTLRAPAYLLIGVATLAVVAGVVLLVDTFLNYGPLYRRETAAVAVSAVPPGLALLIWAGGVGPVPQLNLAPIMFVPHVVLDAYAFGRAELFERDPTTVRAAERTAIDDLADPILIVDREGRIVRLNDAARAAFVGSEGPSDPRNGTGGPSELRPADAVLDRPVESLLGVSLEFDGDTDPFEHRTDGERRTYAVSVSRLADPGGTHVGWTVACSDVTDRERRRQQLEVFNRVLRHNLRNDAGVVHGYADYLVDRLDDDELHRMADAIERRSAALESLGEKARTVETLLDGEPTSRLRVGSVVERIVADARESAPDAEIDLDVRTDATATVPERTLEAAVENLLENALRHHDGAGVERSDGGAWARVTVDGDDALLVRVADDGPGIPDAELDAIRAGEETDLQHGSGLGLWVVHWAVSMLGAEVEYADRDPRGTVATLRLPRSG
jgi:signal transduction histidine kinase